MICLVLTVEAESRNGADSVGESDAATPMLGICALETLGLKWNLVGGELEVVGLERGFSDPERGFLAL